MRRFQWSNIAWTERMKRVPEQPSYIKFKAWGKYGWVSNAAYRQTKKKESNHE